MTTPPTSHKALLRFVEDFAALATPERVEWCDGSPAERDRLSQLLIDQGTVVRLDPAKRPASFWARSDPRDVARVEARTFICSVKPDDAGPTNNWADPHEMRARLTRLFSGLMRGRTMYVLAFSMGPIGSPIARLGVQLTKSAYVALSMGTMTRVGTAALHALGDDGQFVPRLHSVGAPLAPGTADVACGYHMADYFSHWLSFAERTDPAKLPRIYSVNWFRKDTDGHFLWPGFGENARVLAWIFDRCAGRAAAVPTPIGNIPAAGALELAGLDVDASELATLLEADVAEWRRELAAIEAHYATFGDRLPAALERQLHQLAANLEPST